MTEEELYEHTQEYVTYPELIPCSFRPVEHADNDYLIDQAVQRATSVTGIKSVPAQDRAVTDSMGRIYDRTREHLGTSDTVIIAVRRRLIRMARRWRGAKRRRLRATPRSTASARWTCCSSGTSLGGARQSRHAAAWVMGMVVCGTPHTPAEGLRPSCTHRPELVAAPHTR